MFVNVTIKETKDKKDREVVFSLDFVDVRTRLFVASVNITSTLAKGLIDALGRTIEQADEFLKTGKQPKVPIKTETEASSYIG